MMPSRLSQTISSRTVLLLTLIIIANVSFGAEDKCYPGLDCPKDIPNYNPPPRTYISPTPNRYTPPPSNTRQNCSNPFANFSALLFGGQVSTCNLPATHCCFSDGSSVPMNISGSITFGASCVATMNMFGMNIPVQGLGCRR